MTETVAARNATLQDLAAVLQDQQGHKLDLIVPATKMRARGGDLVLEGTEAEITEHGVTPTEGVYTPTQVFDEGVAAKLGISGGYLRRLRDEAVDLYDLNVNGWLHGGGGRGPDARSFYVRLFRGDGGQGVARALLSDQYAALDNFDVLTAVLQGVNDSGTPVHVRDANLTDRRMSLRLFAPEVAAMAPTLMAGYRSPFDNAGTERRSPVSDLEYWRGVADREGKGYDRGAEPVVFAGFRVANSEVGNGRFTVTPELLLKVCRNGLVIKDDTFGKRHVGGKLDEGVIAWSADTQRKQLEVVAAQSRDAVRQFLDEGYLQTKIAEIEAAAGKPIAEPEKTIKAVAKVQGYTQAETDGILSHFIQGGQMTAGGVLNAVTSFSQCVADADRADEIDRDALGVLSLV